MMAQNRHTVFYGPPCGVSHGQGSSSASSLKSSNQPSYSLTLSFSTPPNPHYSTYGGGTKARGRDQGPDAGARVATQGSHRHQRPDPRAHAAAERGLQGVGAVVFEGEEQAEGMLIE